jgi:hypothetical protein
MTTCWGATLPGPESPRGRGHDVIVVVIALDVQPRLVARLARKLADPILRRQKDGRMSGGTCLR